MAYFEEMFERMQKIKEGFEEAKKHLEQRDKKVEEIRKYHEEEIKKIFEVIEKRDTELKEYIQQKECDELKALIDDIGFLIDEMFSTRLKLIEQEEKLQQKKGK